MQDSEASPNCVGLKQVGNVENMDLSVKVQTAGEDLTTREPSYFCKKENRRMVTRHLFAKFFENLRI